MHYNKKLVHMFSLLLFEGFGLDSPCLHRFALWAHGLHIAH